MSFDFSTLVTDRAQADVDRVKAIAKKIENGTASESELAEFNSAAMKGAYNYTDLNRVTAAMEALKAKLEGYGYAVPGYQRIEVPHPEEVRLPEGYTELAWIESSGTQYIDTGVKSTANTRIKLTLKLQTISGDQKVFGGYESNGGINLGVYNNKWRLGASNWENNTLSATTEKTVIEAERNTWIINGSTLTISSAIANAYNSNMFVFGICYNGALLQTDAISVYELCIYDNDVPIRYFIPCISPSGEVGLYDTVTKKFYRNQGTGVFTAGNKVSDTIVPDYSCLDPYLWYETDVPTVSQMNQYLANVEAIRSVLKAAGTTPVDMTRLTTSEANEIEEILVLSEKLINNMVATFVYSGQVYSGMVWEGFK